MKIYDYKGFPNPARVRIALAEKNMTDQVTFVTIDVPGGEHKRPAYLMKNPSGMVPALELEDGAVISECSGAPKLVCWMRSVPISTMRHPASDQTSRLTRTPHGASTRASVPSPECGISTRFWRSGHISLVMPSQWSTLRHSPA
jgi:hypothetical protein